MLVSSYAKFELGEGGFLSEMALTLFDRLPLDAETIFSSSRRDFFSVISFFNYQIIILYKYLVEIKRMRIAIEILCIHFSHIND